MINIKIKKYYPIFFLLAGTPCLAQQGIVADTLDVQPIFSEGQAQIVPAFNKPSEWLKEELWVETDFDSDNDGALDRMHVFVTRPRQTNNQGLKLPIVYTSSPYYGIRLLDMLRTPKQFFWDVKQELGTTPKARKHPKLKRREKRPVHAKYMDAAWVPRGYIMVYSSSPGTGLSDGVPTIGGKNEAQAPKAVIDWLCGRGHAYRTRKGNNKVYAFWSSGKVGMIGTSYDGTIALAAATTGVEGLEAIIPIAAVSSWYHYYRSNGLVRSPGGYPGEDMDVIYDFIHTADKNKRKSNNTRIRDSILAKFQDRVTGDYNAFWASRDYTKQMNNMKAAALICHGLNDWNVMPEHSYRLYREAQKQGVPVQLYYHERGHGGDPPFKLSNKWFTKYLHGIDNKVEKDAKLWIKRDEDYIAMPYEDFPDPKSSNVKLFLNSGNPSNGQLSTTTNQNNTTEKFVDDYSIEGRALYLDALSDKRLLYKTTVLKKDIRLSGVTRFTTSLSCNKPTANFSVWLVSLPGDEIKKDDPRAYVITRGWADPQNHHSLTQGEPLKKGTFYDLTFDLNPDDQIIAKGQRIGLMIFSSDNEFTLHPKPGTELTIDLNKTSVTLPIVGGLEALEAAIEN